MESRKAYISYFNGFSIARFHAYLSWKTEDRRRKSGVRGKSEIRILKAEMPKQQVDGNQQILYRI